MAAVAFCGDQKRRAGDERALYPMVPIGYRFVPRDDELILDYLVNKIKGSQLPSNVIKDIEFYEYDPHDLPNSDFRHGKNKNEAYYFTQIQQRDSKSEGTARKSKGGYWKACDEDEDEEEIYYGDEIVGFKTIFEFYSRQEKQGMGRKSCWVMHEFRVDPSNTTILPTKALADDTIKGKMQRWVICRIVNKDDTDSIEEAYSQQSFYDIKNEEEEHSHSYGIKAEEAEEGPLDEQKICNLNSKKKLVDEPQIIT